MYWKESGLCDSADEVGNIVALRVGQVEVRPQHEDEISEGLHPES